jgi:hypothetical protein
MALPSPSISIQNGTPVNIAFQGTVGGLTIPSLPAVFILQKADETGGAENYRVKDNVGAVIVSAWMDAHFKASLEFLITGTTIATAMANTILTGLTPGTLLNISACASMPDLQKMTWEIMDSPKISKSNTDAAMFSLNIEYRAGIVATLTG